MSPALVDCDVDDKVGCAMGLVCGGDNCAKFHTIGGASGFKSSTDCCDGKVQGKLRSKPNFSSISVTFAKALLATFIVLKALDAPNNSWALPTNC